MSDRTTAPAPVEAKVKAATLGAGAGGVLASFLVWAADQIWWNGDAAPDVPAPVVAVITVAAAGVAAFVAGYRAKHTPRSGS